MENIKSFQFRLNRLIEEKYSLIDRFKIVLNKKTDTQKYAEYKTYFEDCKNKILNNSI
jgi:hypothetical protein